MSVIICFRGGWSPPSPPCASAAADGDPHVASEKPGISYSWRSILRGFEALKEGLIWRVGDGTRINIWSDAWIPNMVTRRPRTPRTPRGRTVLSKVSDLISPITGTWDEQLIRDVFWDEDVQDILSIPVKPDYEDTVA